MKLKMKLVQNRKETPDTSTLTFESAQRPPYKPGQFFMIEFIRPEKIPKRSYSVSSSPTRQGILELTVKQMPQGWISKMLNDAKPGEEFMLDGPWGHFTFDEQKMGDVVMLAAGSGVAPFRAFCQYIIDKKLSTKVTLAYGSRTEKDIICKNDLLEFQKRIKGMDLILALSREEKEGYHFGRVDGGLVKSIAGRKPNASYFICGPLQMVNDAEKALLEAGIPKERVKTEKYG